MSQRDIGIPRFGAESGNTLVTFVIYFVMSRAQQGRFERWWELGARMDKGFQKMAILYYSHSRFS